MVSSRTARRHAARLINTASGSVVSFSTWAEQHNQRSSNDDDSSNSESSDSDDLEGDSGVPWHNDEHISKRRRYDSATVCYCDTYTYLLAHFMYSAHAICSSIANT